MKITKIAKPGKIMPQPPKKPNSGKMDSQIFIGKEDPQHVSKKNKKSERTAESSNVWTDFDSSFEYNIAGIFYSFPYHASISESERNDTIELSDKPDNMPDNIWDQVWEDMEDIAQTKAYEEWDRMRGKSVTASGNKTKKKKGKKKEWDPNPWAVCEVSVGKKENPEKFERCVMDVKKNQAFNLKEYKTAQQHPPRYIPGQEPYSDEEYEKLTRILDEAAEGDPGELNEPHREDKKVYRDGDRILILSGHSVLDLNLKYHASIRDKFNVIESATNDATLSEIYLWAKEHNFNMKAKGNQAFNLKRYVTSGFLDEEIEDTLGSDVEEYEEEYGDEEKSYLSLKSFGYFIDLDERGEFFADVRNSDGETVFEIKGYDIFRDGFMKHKEDLDGLEEYLVSLGIMKDDDELVKGN